MSCVFCSLFPKSKETILICSSCSSVAHSACLSFSPTLVENTQSYDWQCMDCKQCFVCLKKEDPDALVFCDYCDRAYHSYCHQPQLESIQLKEFKCFLCKKNTSSVQSPKKEKHKNLLLTKLTVKEADQSKTMPDEHDQWLFQVALEHSRVIFSLK